MITPHCVPTAGIGRKSWILGRRKARNRRDLMLTVPAGHWREAEILAEQGFPERKVGEPYVVVVHQRGAGAFILDGVYSLLEDHVPGDAEVVRLARLHHVDSWEGWMPSEPENLPWWAKKGSKEDFTAYWVAE